MQIFTPFFSPSLSVNDNRLIVLSIHQPRYSIFKLFDSLSLLSRGEIVYHGKASMALDYFDQLGKGLCVFAQAHIHSLWRFE